MPFRYAPKDPLYDSEFPDEEDQADDDEVEMLDCPACGASVYEEAEQCPHCGEYIVHSSAIWLGKSPAWILLGLAGIAAVVVAMALG